MTGRRTLWVGLAAVIGLALLPTLAIRAAGYPNGLWLISAWLTGPASGRAGGDSWIPIGNALSYVMLHGAAGLYQETYFQTAFQFIYPPTSLVLIALIAKLGLFDWHSQASMNYASWWAVPAMMLALARLTLAAFRQREITLRPVDLVLAGALGFILVLLSYPLLRGVQNGQIQTLLSLLLTLSLLAWVVERKMLSGFLLGIICIIKPHLAIFVIWGAIRREWRFTFVLVLTGMGFLVASLVIYGWQVHLEYLDLLRFLSRRGESFVANQSMNGLLNRMLFIGNNLEWDGTHTQIFFDARVYVGTLLSSAALIGLALLWRRKAVAGPLDYCLALVAFTLASPVAYNDHFGMLPAVFVLALPAARGWAVWATLAIAVLLTASDLEIADATAATHWNFLQSYLMFGAWSLIGALLAITRADRISRPLEPRRLQ